LRPFVREQSRAALERNQAQFRQNVPSVSFPVEDFVEEMWVLEVGHGIDWKAPNSEVLFACRDFAYPLASEPQTLDAVENMLSTVKNSLDVKALGIYHLMRA
jgi:hypothetical protein